MKTIKVQFVNGPADGEVQDVPTHDFPDTIIVPQVSTEGQISNVYRFISRMAYGVVDVRAQRSVEEDILYYYFEKAERT